MLVDAPRPSDDLETFKRRVCLAISRLSTSKLGQSASPAFAGLTVGGGPVSGTLIGQWNTAYSWGDHAGLYDTIGAASGEIDDHESTYDHSLLHSPVTLDVLTGITLTGQQLSYTAGYAIPTTAKQAEWDSAYTHKTTEDAINGLVSCDGSGTYTAKVIGADVQAYDADLTAIAALTPTDGNIIVGDGSTWVAESGDTARTSLGLGTGNSPTFTALILSGTTKALYAGPWPGAPDVISAHSNIYGDLFCGNVGENVGRYRLTSNANFGYLFWNEYYDNSYERQMDTTKPSYSLAFAGSGDYCSIRRSAAGVNPISWSNLLHIAGSTGIVTAGGKIRSNTAFNLNGTDGVSNSSSGVPTALTVSGGIVTSVTKNDWLDQSVKTTATPTFTNLALSTTSSANFPTFYCADSSANYTPWFRNDGRSVEMTLDSFRDSTSGSFLAMRHARGSVASPEILKNNDEVASFFARAYDGVSAWRNAAGLMFIVGETPTAGFSPPTSIRFYVSNGTTTSWQWAGAFQYDGKFGVGTLAPQEGIHCTTKIRSNVAFNLNGADGVTQAASAGTVCDVTALAGGIATAQTQITYAADGTYNFDATSGKVSSITIINGRITAITTA